MNGRIRIFAAVLAIGGGPLLAEAQTHPGGIMIGGQVASTVYERGISRIDPVTGRLTTLVDSELPGGKSFVQSAYRTAADNHHVVFGTIGTYQSAYQFKYGVFRADPNTGLVRTLAHKREDFSWVRGVALTQDGEWLVQSPSLFGSDHRIYRIQSSGGYTTMLTSGQLGFHAQFNVPMERDVDSGHMLVPAGPVLRVTGEGAFTTWHTGNGLIPPSLGFSQEIASGDLVYLSGQTLYRTARGNGPTTTIFKPPVQPEVIYCAKFDNQSLATPMVLTVGTVRRSTLSSASVHWIDPIAKKVVKSVTIRKANARVRVPDTYKEIDFYRSRYIQTVRTGAGRWNIYLQFPTRPARNYVLVAGMSGVRPGFRTPDGRHVWLNPDSLFWLTLGNLAPGIFDPGPGVLGVQGRAQGRVDVSALSPRQPLGATIWMIALVLDAAAPSGISFVTEPYPLSL
jgi:hypothetical protein